MANGGETSFTIKFKPLNTSEVVAEIIIPNDGEENQDFSFRVYGKGLKEKPVICISNEKNESIGLASTVDFGFVTVGTSYSSKFYVQNIGRKPLVLTGTTKIEISGSGADFFELTSVPGDTISAGGKSLLEITLSERYIGRKSLLRIRVKQILRLIQNRFLLLGQMPTIFQLKLSPLQLLFRMPPRQR